MQPSRIAVAQVAQKVRFDVSLREELLIAPETGFAGSEERLRYFIVPDQAPSTTVNRIGPLGEEL